MAAAPGAVAPAAIGSPESSVAAPYLHWDVAPSVAGTSFSVEYRTRTWRGFLWWGSWSSPSAWSNPSVVSDCTSACDSAADRDADPGEFQVQYVGAMRVAVDTTSTRYEYRITPNDAPSGYAWVSAEPTVTAASDWIGSTHDAGTFALGRNAALPCTGSGFYSLQQDGAVIRVSVGTNGVATSTANVGQFPGQMVQANALGIGAGGTVMYGVDRASTSDTGIRAILKYSVSNGWERLPLTGTNASTTVSIVGGAVNPLDGNYYFGGFRTQTSVYFDLYRYNATTGVIGRVGTFNTALTTTSSNNGDLAFDATGTLYVLRSGGANAQLFSVPANAVVGAANGATLPFSPVSQGSIGALNGVNGIAFGGDGTVFLADAARAIRISLSGTSAWTVLTDPVTTQLGASGDLAGCSVPPTITVIKNVVGRAAATDQFRLIVRSSDRSLGTAETVGGATGIQSAQVGPIPVIAGQTYTVAEEMVSGNATLYASSFSCVDERGTPVASGQGRTGQLPMPGRPGANVVCTFTNAPLTSSVIVHKVVQLASGAERRAAGWTMTAVASAQSGSITPPAAQQQVTDSDGSASWSVRFGSAAARASVVIAEVQQVGHVFVQGLCEVTAVGGESREVSIPRADGVTLTDIAPGSAIECTFVSRELPTTLTLLNTIGFGDAGLAPQWQLRGTGPQSALPGPAGSTGSASATATVTPNVAYALAHSGGPASYAQVGSWTCRDQGGASVPVTASGVSIVKGTQVTCTVTNSTARLTLLKHIDSSTGGTLRADMFTLTATPASRAGLAAISTRGSETEIAIGTAVNRFDVRPNHAYTLAEQSTYASLGLRLERQTGPNAWVTVSNPSIQVPAGEQHTYRFVNAPVPALALPLTGGIGADTYVMGGGALLLLALAFILFRSRRSAQREPGPTEGPTKTPSIHLLTARIQKGLAHMATTKKGPSARIAAGFVAAAIATVTILGGAFPASAAPDNIQSPTDEPRSLTIHKFAQPSSATGLRNDGREIPQADITARGLQPLSGVEFTVTRVPGVELTTNAGWTAAAAMTVAQAEAAISAPGATVDSRADDTINGVVRFDGLADGLYLVTETDLGDNQIAIPAQPFLMTLPLPVANEWVYDVHVYPKNSTGDIEKRVVAGDAAVLGDVVNWEIDSFVPHTPASHQITSYVLEDTLDPRLEYVPTAEVRIGTLAQLDSATPPAPLTLGVDYTATFDVATRAATLTLSTSIANGADGQTLRVSYPTRVVAVGDGAIANTATVIVNGNEVASSTDTTYWGSVRVVKHAGTDQSARLDGARFELRSANDGAAVAADPTTVVAVGTAGSNGEITFEGVITSATGTTYYLVETEAPVGYERATVAEALTVRHGQPVDGGQNFVYFANNQIAAYALPITGGSGQAAFMIGGAGLILGGLGFVLLRRRKTQAAEQA